MKEINLREFYPWYMEDVMVEVTEEVAEELLAGQRYIKASRRRIYRNKAHYSLNAEDGIEYSACLRCRKKLMTNITFQNGRKARNTWLAGKIKCGKCGYALKTTHNPSGYEYLRCSKRADHKGCPGCGTLRKNEFEQFIFTAMGEKFREFKLLRGGEEKANPKITAYQVELAQVEAEIEKLLDTLTGANATLLAYANKKIEDLDNRGKTLAKAIADLSVETLSSQQIELLSGYLDDWENISFGDKRKAADGLISSISATSDYVKIEWKI